MQPADAGAVRLPLACAARMVLRWWAAALVGSVWLVLGVALFATEPASGRSHATLGALCLCTAALWLAAAALIHGTPGGRPLPIAPPDIGSALILLGGLALTATVTVRLLCASSFGGHAPSLDFGCGCADGQNVAFGADANSVGHCIQGALSILLFPTVERAISATGRWRLRRRLLTRAAAAGVAVYPVYNLAKRAAKARDSFAASSFSSNGLEWAFGFVLGLSLGLAAAAAAHRAHAMRQSPSPPPPQLSEHARRAERAVDVLRVLAGVLLCAVTVVATALLCATWTNRDQPRRHVDAVQRAAVVLAPVATIAALCCAAGGCWCIAAGAPARGPEGGMS